MADSQRLQYLEKEINIRVWDLPVRVTHWLLAMLVLLSWLTAEYRWFEWHRWSGYSILTLALFRSYWGFCGSTTAQFTNFLYGPGTVGRFARSFFSRTGSTTVVGHNPVGGWNVLAMLLLLLVQCGLGLFAVDVDAIESGPLTRYVSFDVGRLIAELHGTVFYVLTAFIVLHIVAVFAHLLIKRENLIRPMITGVKSVSSGEIPVLRFVAPWRALLALAAIALLVLGLAKGL